MKLKKKKRHLWLKITLFILIISLVSTSVYAFSFYQSFASATQEMHVTIEREKSEKRSSFIRFEEHDPFSVLLLGVDEREGDRGRSDTIIVMTVNPQTEKTHLLSIPRDTYTEVIGYGRHDKINHAYAFGGVEMTIATVEHFLDIPIDYFVKINMEGFEDIVNAVGGITINNHLSFESEGYNFNEGEITLDGNEALAYSRMRYEDPNGDFGRQERQRKVIEAVLREGAGISSLWNFNNIFNVIGSNVKTNLTVENIMDIQNKYRPALNQINQRSVEGGSDVYINDIYYYQIPPEQIKQLQGELQDELGL
ncbi:LCP family protein [Jeotgalibacillus salarius]|uniref:LytR family transcriptional regulator n=1 Tax=Jeotgalibacillus salarius TaxID=546023 RepID=A0A4Y8LRC2_9BACL|nr:LCP family protein [Jeotgalibacillus salarius]TFE04009.1 LytR family transcriptional regulator [Jeotgalibacillus salarius]